MNGCILNPSPSPHIQKKYQVKFSEYKNRRMSAVAWCFRFLDVRHRKRTSKARFRWNHWGLRVIVFGSESCQFQCWPRIPISVLAAPLVSDWHVHMSATNTSWGHLSLHCSFGGRPPLLKLSGLSFELLRTTTARPAGFTGCDSSFRLKTQNWVRSLVSPTFSNHSIHAVEKYWNQISVEKWLTVVVGCEYIALTTC